MVFVDKWPYQDVAIRLRISKALVTRVVKAYKADSTLVEQLYEKERSLERKIMSVKESVDELISRDRCIRKISLVQQAV